MLTNGTKKLIDTARDILVGKLPDPKSQVEQITIALIYKFMDDMDKQSEELGGKAKFFTGEYAKYAWSKIFDPRVSGHELVGLYGEAIQRMNHNPNIPQLFRDIFKNAYLPYRDPETLKSFLKAIGEFEYDHSEKLGDAFEYLLSVMGSQGDAGQFRTPRHIIDFMVKVVDPGKNETILDPACGTAGFLISSYKHILEKNKKDGRVHLTPAQKKRLIENFSGYDISPDMVRLSLANMYLHGFKNPKIYEYDTLTSEEKWQEVFDVILANPPFMSPRGGIKPHKRFNVQAKRSEVLFVDYMAEHLNPNGRAGIIVPEGIIFQSGTAYKQLRKMLVDHSLYAVVSLPAGVFNPYSGVKTSILMLDKNLAKKTNRILFVKINNDGFGLGAQRKEVSGSDLPLALEVITKYKRGIIENKEFEFNTDETKLASLVEKTKIAENGDYNLSGDRYRGAIVYSGKWEFVELGEVIDYEQPTNYIVETTDYNNEYEIPVLTAGKSFLLGYTNEKEGVFLREKLPVIIFDDFTTATKLVDFPFKVKSSAMKILKAKKELVNIKFAFYVMQKIKFDATRHKRYWISQYSKIKIPLPPLEMQEQIVVELDNYQKVIDGARQVVENYRPHIDIDPECPVVALGGICNLIGGGTPSKQEKSFWKDGTVKWISSRHIDDDGNIIGCDTITEQAVKKSSTNIVPKNSTVAVTRVSVGKVAFLDDDYAVNQDLTGLCIKDKRKVSNKYLFYMVKDKGKEIDKNAQGLGVRGITRKFLAEMKVALPAVEVQEEIVTKIEKEQKAVETMKDLITIFEQKIKDRIVKVWGEQAV